MSQITAIGAVAQGLAPLPATQGAGSADFGALLGTGVSELVTQNRQATELLAAYAMGESVSPHDLVMAMEQARLSMQLAVEMRNRVVDAYQELTRLQV